MRPLSASDVISLWELGQSQHPLERAIALLGVACPELSQKQLAALSIGQRDGRLLTLRELTFGSTLTSLTPCPKCRDRLEFTLDVADLRVGEFGEVEQEYRRQWGEYECQFRLPNSLDLAAITGCRDVESAREILMQRCLLHIRRSGVEVSYRELSGDATPELARLIGECDPQAEVLLDLDCPACGYQWQLMFDILSFLWYEVTALAKRLLQDVHRLAQAYGWREADILAMSAMRRQFYLERVMG